MTSDRGTGLPLEFLVEPALILRRKGEILGSNAAAQRLLGAGLESRNLFEWVAGPFEEFDDFLRRASGSASPIVGSLSLNAADGLSKFRAHGARLPQQSLGDTRLILRCLSVQDDQFSFLDRRVRELDSQLRKRLQENAALEEALAQNRTLLRELQHRVKNNVQLMMSLIQLSAKGREAPEVTEFVQTARLRLRAMASTQEAIYQSAHIGTVSTRDFLEDIIGAIGASLGFADNLELAIEDAELESEDAHCLALIANELITNAGKHGLRNGRGTIRVSFGCSGGGFRLVVHDDGPGFTLDAGGRSSGLMLVRGLCRQIGGSLEVLNERGTCCILRFGGGHSDRSGS